MIGIIADDVTGGTDVAVACRRQGLRTGIVFGAPSPGAIDTSWDVAVVALKTRTIPAADAVAQSLSAAEALRAAGATQLYLKYCSTFDSTAEGNIGPVLDALAALVGAERVVTTPSSPEHGRTVDSGQLLVHGTPLAESPMRDHPLTPMRDSDLVRLLDGQLPAPASATVALDVVRRGPDALRGALSALAPDVRYVLPDAVTDDDLVMIARSAASDPLWGGAAGFAGALARVVAEQRGGDVASSAPPTATGRAVVLAGSCSQRTLEQIDAMLDAGRPAFRLDALREQDPERLAAEALAWYDALDSGAGPDSAPLVYASLPPAQLHEVQKRLGVAESAAILETALSRVAQGLRERGVRRFVTAGGETSGAVVAALGVAAGEIGAEAARGVPWIHSSDGIRLLLKSGNFGEVDLLVTASADIGERAGDA
ncbi:3-oxo-tetronate kinase [Microbacterium sp. GCS4]|uniref:3-oxo-tetronate kinase n=1 Tax=Microbacterium sp. GCS4 TaxID=1692239 RepID=UPI00068186AE|nr:3-oxo-tetronate kinase [Microbacterium sp. GCS4]KNY05945.1 Hrp-dependent type III effector protein [Microbacterium sp. GCS4]